MLVEMVGIPGAGKTTVVRELLKLDNDFRLVRQSHLHRPRNILCPPSRYLAFLKFSPASLRYKGMGEVVNGLTKLLLEANATGFHDGHWLLDQGAVQRYAALAMRQPGDPSEAARKLQKLVSIFTPRLLLFVKTDVSAAVERLDRRSTATANVARGEVEVKLQWYSQVLELAFSEKSRIGASPVAMVDGGCGASDVKDVLAVIRERTFNVPGF